MQLVLLGLLLSGCSLLNRSVGPTTAPPTPIRAVGTEMPSELPTTAPTLTDTPPSEPGETATNAPTVTPTRRPLPPTPLPSIIASGHAYYVDGQKGGDSNPGSADAPWRTLRQAITSIHSGDTVIIAAGIYRLTELKFGPAGNPGALTTFQAAPGARVLITGPDDGPIQINLADYVRLDGLWMGGVFDPKNKHIIAMGGNPLGHGKEIVNSTIFGYVGGIVVGAGESYLFQNNRLVNNGKDQFSAGLYVSSGVPIAGTLTNHVLIDHNIFVGGGIGFQGWHGPVNIIATRNFVGGAMLGSAFDGYDHLIANNFFWNQKGVTSSNLPPYGMLIGVYPNVIANNIFGPHAWLDLGNASTTLPNLTVLNNAFTNQPNPPGTGGPICKSPCGSGGTVLHQGQELAELGITASDLDNTIQALQNSFLQPVSSLFIDQTIEPNFAKLRITIPKASPLYQSGTPWFGRPLNIGPDAPAPSDSWSAFRALGLHEYNRFGNQQ